MPYVRITSIVLWGQWYEVMSAAVMLLRSHIKLLSIVWRCLFCLKLPSCVRFLSHSLERSMASKLRHMFWRWSSSRANNRLVLSLWLQSHHFLLVYQRLSQLCHVGGVLCSLHCCIKINFVCRLPLIVLFTSANNRACLLLDIGVRSKSLPSMLLITTCHCFSRWWSFVLGPSCSSFLRSCRTCCFVFFIIWKIEQWTELAYVRVDLGDLIGFNRNRLLFFFILLWVLLLYCLRSHHSRICMASSFTPARLSLDHKILFLIHLGLL